MWAVTGWALATWARVTVLLGLGVLLAWLTLDPGWFWLVTGLVTLAALAVVVATIRWGLRVRRERREDAADALAAAAWRARHMPHLAARLDRHDGRPVGVGVAR